MTKAIVKKTIVIMIAAIVATAFLITDFSFAGTADTEAAASQQIMNGIAAHKSKVTVSLASTNNDAQALAKDLFADALEMSEIADYYKYSVYNGYKVSYSWYEEDGVYNYTFNYTIKYKTTMAQERAFEKKLARTMKSLKLNGKSNKAKVQIIYRYVTKNVKYDKTSKGYTKYTAYAALNKKKAVCQGYSTLFFRMCEAAGVDCKIVTGKSLGQNHAWNIVRIGKKYYNVDATWDAGKTAKKYKYFLKGNKKFKKHVRSSSFRTSYFNKAYPTAR